MNSKKLIGTLSLLVFLLPACAQTVPKSNSNNTPTSVTRPSVSSSASPIGTMVSLMATPVVQVEPTATLQPTTPINPSDVPYYDRTYRLLYTCNSGTCLFYDDVMKPPYPLGYALLSGHYVRVTRASVNGGTEDCDGFIIDNGPKELLSAYETYYSSDAGVFSRTTDGKMVINIPLFDEDEMTKDLIFSSSSKKPIDLHVVNGPPIMRGVVSCFSPVNIVGVFKPPDASQLSQVWVITEADNGKTFTYTLTTRFTVELDNAKHPLSQLKCEPKPIYGYISNGSSGDPDKYPIRYEIGETGKCQMQNGNFHVNIVGVP